MKHIKSYKKYKESLVIDLVNQIVDISESLNVWHDLLLSAIGAKEVNIFDTFKMPKDDHKDRLDIDYLSNNVEFINSLASIALKKSQVQNTDDFSCFINKPCKFMFIYGVENNELENPLYILFQVWNETLKKWDEVKLYKINDDVKKFYDKLSSKTIEITDGSDNYIYTSGNAGNEWNLQNTNMENDTYKKIFRKEELQKLLDEKKVKLEII